MIMEIKAGLKVKDMQYPEEKVYKIVGIDNDSVIPIVILKPKKRERFDPKKTYTAKKTFWDRYELIKEQE